MSDTRTYTYNVPRETEINFDWVVRKTESLAKGNPNADFVSLIQDAVMADAERSYGEAIASGLEDADDVLWDIVNDVLWDRRDDLGKIAAKYSNTCTLF